MGCGLLECWKKDWEGLWNTWQQLSPARGAGIYNLHSTIKAGPHLPPQHHSDKEINEAEGDKGEGGE